MCVCVCVCVSVFISVSVSVCVSLLDNWCWYVSAAHHPPAKSLCGIVKGHPMPLPSSESSSESSSPHSTEMCSMTTTSSITDSIEGSPCKYIFFQILKSHLFFQVFFFWCSICITQLVATHLASFIRLLKLFNATTIGMFIWVHRVSPLFFVSSFVSSPKVWTLSKLRVASQVVELEELKSGKFSTQEKSDFLKSSFC